MYGTLFGATQQYDNSCTTVPASSVEQAACKQELSPHLPASTLSRESVVIVKDDPSKLIVGGRKALLINPPIYDTQYWARWSQPHGLLRIASWLREHHGYTDLRLLDCLATNKKRQVRYRHRPDGIIQRGNIKRRMYEFGWPQKKLQQQLERHARGELFYPDEVWITSLMTYWWESTRDVVRLVQEVFDQPRPRIYVGGVYPTLCPDHANKNLSGTDEVIVVRGEICDEAANSWTDLSLYEDEIYETLPHYALVTGSRGCPYNCDYCAQRELNAGRRCVQYRDPQDIAEELRHKQEAFNIREIAFYEDNMLLSRDDFLARLDAIERLGLRFSFYAPEGIEPRLVDKELLTRMRQLGFKKMHLALETIDDSISRGWGRRQATAEAFDQAVEIAKESGFRIGNQDLNAFVLFGLPGEDLQAVVNTALYASHRVGSVVPMLFTPVPGSTLYKTHRDYLREEMGWDLHQLNGKLLPFLEYNQQSQYYPELQASDYLELESLMIHVNMSKVKQKCFDFAGDNPVANTFRRVVASGVQPICP